MYWPIGAPRIYAASSSKAKKDRVLEFDDDLEYQETTEGSRSPGYALGDESAGRGEDDYEHTSGVSTPVTPMTPGIVPVEHDTQRFAFSRQTGHELSLPRSADKEPLLDLKISRTGHLFAVITSTSLTIWQAKVCHLRPLADHH